MTSLRAPSQPAGLAFLTTLIVIWAAKPVAATAGTSTTAQLRRGEEIAQLQCAACHVVAENQKYPPLLENPAPSFQGIAKRPQLSEVALRHFILTTHWDQKTLPLSMPNPGLTPDDTAAVIRYILSLKGH